MVRLTGCIKLVYCCVGHFTVMQVVSTSLRTSFVIWAPYIVCRYSGPLCASISFFFTFFLFLSSWPRACYFLLSKVLRIALTVYQLAMHQLLMWTHVIGTIDIILKLLRFSAPRADGGALLYLDRPVSSSYYSGSLVEGKQSVRWALFVAVFDNFSRDWFVRCA